MTWNRVQYKLAGRVQADAENSSRWNDITVNSLFALTFDRAWRRVLDADACYRYTKLTVTPDSDGFVSLASINAQIAPDRFYRCIDQTTVRNRGLATLGEVVLDPLVIGENVRFVNPTISGNVSLWVNRMPQANWWRASNCSSLTKLQLISIQSQSNCSKKFYRSCLRKQQR